MNLRNLSLRKKTLFIIIVAVLIIGGGLVYWAIKTGKIRPRAESSADLNTLDTLDDWNARGTKDKTVTFDNNGSGSLKLESNWKGGLAATIPYSSLPISNNNNYFDYGTGFSDNYYLYQIYELIKSNDLYSFNKLFGQESTPLSIGGFAITKTGDIYSEGIGDSFRENNGTTTAPACLIRYARNQGWQLQKSCLPYRDLLGGQYSHFGYVFYLDGLNRYFGIKYNQSTSQAELWATDFSSSSLTKMAVLTAFPSGTYYSLSFNNKMYFYSTSKTLEMSPDGSYKTVQQWDSNTQAWQLFVGDNKLYGLAKKITDPLNNLYAWDLYNFNNGAFSKITTIPGDHISAEVPNKLNIVAGANTFYYFSHQNNNLYRLSYQNNSWTESQLDVKIVDKNGSASHPVFGSIYFLGIQGDTPKLFFIAPNPDYIYNTSSNYWGLFLLAPDETYQSPGTYETVPFGPGTAKWKKIQMDGDFPDGTSTTVKAKSSDDGATYSTDWFDITCTNSSAQITCDKLYENTNIAEKKYLKIKINLSTNDNTKTPRIDKFKLYDQDYVVLLTWDAPPDADGNPMELGFEVWRQKQGDADPELIWAVDPPEEGIEEATDGGILTDENVLLNTTYTYTVYSVDKEGDRSLASTTTITTPATLTP